LFTKGQEVPVASIESRESLRNEEDDDDADGDLIQNQQTREQVSNTLLKITARHCSGAK
jgi:hypothetical protein